MGNSITYDYRILDKYSGPLSKITKATKRFQDTARKASQSVGKMGDRFKAAGDKMSNMHSAVAALGTGALIKTLVQDSLNMADAMADIQKVSDFSGKSLQGLRAQLENLSEKIGRPAEGLARIAFEGKKLGTSDTDIIPFIETVSKMAIAFDMSEEAAGRSIGSIKAKLGLSMDAVISLGDSLNYLADNTTANGENMIDIISRVSGTFSIMKVPPDVAAGFAAVADQLSESSELGASGLNMMFNRMMKMPGMTKKMMNDPMKAVQETMRKFSRLPKDQQPTAILKTFGPEAGRFVMKLVPKMKLFGETMGKAMDKKKVNSMEREMTNYLKRSSTQLKIANQKISNSFRTLGDALTPFIVFFSKIISKIAKFSVQMSINYPILMKITTGILLLGAAITVIVPIIGIIISAMGTLLTIIAGITWPITAAIAGVAAIAAAFSYWVKTGHPIIATLKSIGMLVWEIISPLFKLFGIADAGSGILSILGFAFKMIGFALNLALKPLQIFLTAINALFDTASKLVRLDFKGAFGAFKGGGESIMKIFGFGGDDKVTAASKGASQSAMAPKTQNVNVGGEFVVAAQKGTEIVSVKPNLDIGVNMRSI